MSKLHGRFEFDQDFSVLTSTGIEPETLAAQDSRIGEAYRAGFADGQREIENINQIKLQSLLAEIKHQIDVANQIRQQRDTAIFETLATSLQEFFEHVMANLDIRALIERDQFGLRTLLGSFLSKKDLKIYVSADLHASYLGEQTDVIGNLPVIIDADLSHKDFELRWDNGGAIFKSHDVLTAYLSIISKLNHTPEAHSDKVRS